MSRQRIRIDQQVLAGLIKDRARLTDEIAKMNHLMAWAQACYPVLRKEIDNIDKRIDAIMARHPSTTQG